MFSPSLSLNESIMKTSSMFFIFFLSLLPLLFHLSHSTTILIDGDSDWNNSTVHIGDSITFKHKYGFNIYIFQSQKAFNLCNFSQATLLNKPNSSSYTWNPSRPGFFYFSFRNGSLNGFCEGSEKLAIKVSALSVAPESSPVGAPAPDSGGGIVSSSPVYPWPFQPGQAAASPPSGGASSPVSVPLVPGEGGGGSGNAMPFINSQPAVPLPSGEVDSATIRPLPTSHGGQVTAMSLVAVKMGLLSWVLVMLM